MYFDISDTCSFKDRNVSVLSRSEDLSRDNIQPPAKDSKSKMAPVNGDVKWRCVIVCAILSVLLFERTVCVYTYDRKDLLHILQTVNCEYRPKLLYFSDDLSRDNTQTHTKWRTFQRDSTHRRSRKRGRRAGVLTRFRRRKLRPPFPAIVLTNR